ncbi:hypothetical protein [Nitrococcus mobilis]|uniref:Uncharacterized protein n=1 Tax=Nitrococcus mobilis Nb-231 TaxID=314278 RepID=A4BL30_9GAMM|nr:hypothetical protein [Nitrococcus mobilis]EAR23018.1 hypothetical protein NB231_14398 [Nitrococcus mobilis Nb-231]
MVRATGELTDLSVLAEDWRQRLNLPSPEQAQRLLTSLTLLVAAARLWRDRESEDPEQGCQPFLQVRQQLWLRELRRLGCSGQEG